MRSESYSEGYWERGEGSNYVAYGMDDGWPLAVQALHVLVPVGNLLEFACAKGWFVHTARSAGWDAYGFDLSEYAVGQAIGEVAPYLQVANAVDIPFEDDHFDVVCSWEFLEHVPATEIDWVLSEMERVCKPGGLIVSRIGLDLAGDPSWAKYGVGEDDPTHQQHDVTHVLEMPHWWWRQKAANRGWIPWQAGERVFDKAQADRDWWGRTLVWRKP